MKVGLFVPCLVDQFRPSIAEATFKLLVHMDLAVNCFPEQTCCGQPIYKMGYRNKTKKIAKNVIALFENFDHVVIPSGSCVSMIKREYPEILKEEGSWSDRAMDFAKRVHELTEFICQILKVQDLGVTYPEKITFHDSCQVARALGIKDEPRMLLRHVKGLEILEMDQSDLCCGFGGIFSIKYPWISKAIIREKVEKIVKTGANVVVSCEPSCLMHIEGYMRQKGLPLKVLHVAEIFKPPGPRSQ